MVQAAIRNFWNLKGTHIFLIYQQIATHILTQQTQHLFDDGYKAHIIAKFHSAKQPLASTPSTQTDYY